jgi:CBS domain-containing protein
MKQKGAAKKSSGATIRDVMTANPATLSANATAADAARTMRECDIGDVLVTEDGSGKVCGIVTDRDIVVRAIAEGRDPATTKLSLIASQQMVSVTPVDSVDKAIELMRDRAIRRLAVCEDGKAVGIVSLGDLALDRDRKSALADISAAPANT